MKIKRCIPSEATIQAELYMAIKAAGFTPYLEQTFILNERTRTGRNQRIRVDVLIAHGDEAFAAVEVKNCFSVKPDDYFLHTRQSSKYRQLGLPFTYCTNLSQIETVVKWARSLRPILG